jgi:hypothetical protein
MEAKMTETVLMKTGMKVLIEQLGNIDAERFVSILLREPFDYTEWRKSNLCVGMTIEEISKEAMEVYKQDGAMV